MEVVVAGLRQRRSQLGDARLDFVRGLLVVVGERVLVVQALAAHVHDRIAVLEGARVESAPRHPGKRVNLARGRRCGAVGVRRFRDVVRAVDDGGHLVGASIEVRHAVFVFGVGIVRTALLVGVFLERYRVAHAGPERAGRCLVKRDLIGLGRQFAFHHERLVDIAAHRLDLHRDPRAVDHDVLVRLVCALDPRDALDLGKLVQVVFRKAVGEADLEVVELALGERAVSGFLKGRPRPADAEEDAHAERHEHEYREERYECALNIGE